jgi:hypothetical protein
MPNNGKVFECQALELKVVSAGGGSHSGLGVGSYSHEAYGDTAWAINAIDVEGGFFLHASATDDGTGWTATCHYDGPFAPFGGLTVTVPGSSSAEVRVLLTGVTLYSKFFGSLWRLVIDNVKVYCNGTLYIDQGSIDVTSEGTGPNYVPLLGVPLSLNGSCGAGTAGLPGTMPDTYDYESSMSATATGGWRFQDMGGVWIELPVALPAVGAPSAGSCPFGLSLGGIVSAGATWNATVTSYARSRAHRSYVEEQSASYDVYTGRPLTYIGSGPSQCLQPGGSFGPARRDVYKVESESESKGGWVRLVPNLEKSIRRMQPGYRALWFRGPMPYARASRGRSCTDAGVSSSASDAPELMPAQSQILSCVGDAAHPIEDTLGYASYAPCSVSASESFARSHPEVILTGPCVCPPDGYPPAEDESGGYRCVLVWPAKPADVSQSESAGYSFPATVGPVASYQWHDNKTLRYLGHWANPHWHYFHWFPPNTGATEGDPGDQEQWPVDGAPIVNHYWKLIREQWLEQSSLPAPERRKTRNSLIASALEDSGHTPFMDAFCGENLRWLGISRFKVDAIAPPSSIALSAASAPAWTVTGGTPTFGASIEVAPAGASVSLEYDLGRWTEAPYQFPHGCSHIEIDWASANVQALVVRFVGRDGGGIMIASAPGTYALPTGPARYRAGSWAIDNALGYTDDTGTDIGTGGISAATMADPERTAAFGLLTGRTGGKIRFDVVPIDPSQPVAIHYPEFVRPEEHPTVVWESAQCAALIHEDGPGTRWGNFYWFDPMLGFLDPPMTKGLGQRNTIIDWLCYRREYLQGVHALGGTPSLTTELTQLYDFYEGQSISVVDKFSLAFILPRSTTPTDHTIRAALVNTIAEVPPLACFPYRERGGVNWLPLGDYGQEVWDWGQETRYIVSAGAQPLHLVDPDDTVHTVVETAPDGWSITSHAVELENDETGWKLVRSGREHASVRPWHGWFAALGLDRGTPLDYSVSRNWRHGRAYQKDDAIWLGHSKNVPPLAFNDHVLDLAADRVRIAYPRGGSDDKLSVLYRLEGDGAYRLGKLSEGGTITVSVNLGAADDGDLAWTSNSVLFVYLRRGNLLFGRSYDLKGNALGGEWATTGLGAIDDKPIVVEPFVNDGSQWLSLSYFQGGAMKTAVTKNGVDFT